MAKTATKLNNRPQFSSVQFPRELWVRLGVLAALTRKKRPELLAEVCGPAIENEIQRQMRAQNSKASS